MTTISIGTTNVSLSSLKSAYVNSNSTSASGNSSLRDGSTSSAINLSYFHSANFTHGDDIDSGSVDEITIDTDLKGRTFGTLVWNFEGQNQSTGTGDWSPSSAHIGWENGSSAVNGTYWGLTSNKTVKGWNLDGSGSTGSGGTGPSQAQSGGSSGEYLYTEVSSSRHLYCFVARLPGINFSSAMANTSDNLDLKFYIHAYGSQMGDLFVYIDDSPTSNNSNATSLASYTSFYSFTNNYSSWQQKTISLNSYRTSSSTHYIYFVSQNATGYKGDFSLDTVTIETSSSGGGYCFDVETMVTMSDGSTKRYGDLIQGDSIKSLSISELTETDDESVYLNEVTDTISGIITSSIVQSITTTTYNSYYLINNTIKVTYQHPIMIKRSNIWKWRRVQEIVENDSMYNEDGGETIITSIVNINSSINVATINVSDVNTYFAGGMLAHNK